MELLRGVCVSGTSFDVPPSRPLRPGSCENSPRATYGCKALDFVALRRHILLQSGSKPFASRKPVTRSDEESVDDPRKAVPARAPRSKKRGRGFIVGIIVASLVLGVVAPVLMRTFVVEAFRIPSDSSWPNLRAGDSIFVTKGGPPKTRGELVVFEYTQPGASADYVKRVIALPGDRVEMKAGRLWLNGWQVPRCSVGRYQERDLFVEFLDDSAYFIAYEPEGDSNRYWPVGGGPHALADDEVVVLGDNRDNSFDSRYWPRPGCNSSTSKGAPG